MVWFSPETRHGWLQSTLLKFRLTALRLGSSTNNTWENLPMMFQKHIQKLQVAQIQKWDCSTYINQSLLVNVQQTSLAQSLCTYCAFYFQHYFWLEETHRIHSQQCVAFLYTFHLMHMLSNKHKTHQHWPLRFHEQLSDIWVWLPHSCGHTFDVWNSLPQHEHTSVDIQKNIFRLGWHVRL